MKQKVNRENVNIYANDVHSLIEENEMPIHEWVQDVLIIAIEGDSKDIGYIVDHPAQFEIILLCKRIRSFSTAPSRRENQMIVVYLVNNWSFPSSNIPLNSKFMKEWMGNDR